MDRKLMETIFFVAVILLIAFGIAKEVNNIMYTNKSQASSWSGKCLDEKRQKVLIHLYKRFNMLEHFYRINDYKKTIMIRDTLDQYCPNQVDDYIHQLRKVMKGEANKYLKR